VSLFYWPDFSGLNAVPRSNQPTLIRVKTWTTNTPGLSHPERGRRDPDGVWDVHDWFARFLRFSKDGSGRIAKRPYDLTAITTWRTRGRSRRRPYGVVADAASTCVTTVPTRTNAPREDKVQGHLPACLLGGF